MPVDMRHGSRVLVGPKSAHDDHNACGDHRLAHLNTRFTNRHLTRADQPDIDLK